MTAAAAGVTEQPLVAVICSVPLLCEALAAALEGIAEIRQFPAKGGDTAGLLRSLQPDAVVVDSQCAADAATAFATEAATPLVHVSYRDTPLRYLQDGAWQTAENGAGASVEGIRNILVGGLFGRGRAG